MDPPSPVKGMLVRGEATEDIFLNNVYAEEDAVVDEPPAVIAAIPLPKRCLTGVLDALAVVVGPEYDSTFPFTEEFDSSVGVTAR